MKIGTFTPTAGGAIENVKIFSPASLILIHAKSSTPQVYQSLDFLGNQMKVQVELQNSDTGQRLPIIPFIKASTLAEISTFNEGAVLMDDNSIIYPIMLNPVGNIRLDKDKYLELSLVNCPLAGAVLPSVMTYDIYAFEAPANNDFITKYSKISAPAGTSRQKFNVTSSDLVVLPITGFDSINFTYRNGLVSNMNPVELRYQMAKTNDLTAFHKKSTGEVKAFLSLEEPVAVDGCPVIVDMVMSYGNYFIINTLDIETVEIIRDTNSASVYEFILADLVK